MLQIKIFKDTKIKRKNNKVWGFYLQYKTQKLYPTRKRYSETTVQSVAKTFATNIKKHMLVTYHNPKHNPLYQAVKK